MPPTWVLELSWLSARLMGRYTHAPSCPIASLPLKPGMMLVNGNCWWLRWLLWSGTTGWRRPSILSWFGRTTEIWSTSSRPNDWILGKLVGHYSLVALTSPYSIDPVTKMENLVPYLGSFWLATRERILWASSRIAPITPNSHLALVTPVHGL